MRVPSHQARSAAEALREIERVRVVAIQRSVDNGVVLLVWGLTFLLDMVAFDLSRLTGSPWPAVAFLFCFNGGMLAWRWWYTRRQPVRLRRLVTNRVIWAWAWFYVALIGAGVGGWAVFVGRFPPLWFTLLGVVGALPLLVSGAHLWRAAHARIPSAARRRAGAEELAHGDTVTR